MSYQPSHNRGRTAGALGVGGVLVICLLVGLKIGLRNTVRNKNFSQVFQSQEAQRSGTDRAASRRTSIVTPGTPVEPKPEHPPAELADRNDKPKVPGPAQATGRVLDEALLLRIEQERERLREAEEKLPDVTVYKKVRVQTSEPAAEAAKPAPAPMPNPDAGKVVQVNGFECTDLAQVKPRDIIFIQRGEQWERYLVQVIRGQVIQARHLQNARDVVKVRIEQVRLEQDPAAARLP